LRLGRNDSELFANESVEQRGLASVRAAEDADETGAERHKGGFGLRLSGFSEPDVN